MNFNFVGPMNHYMKALTTILLLIIALSTTGQYYYKDIIVTRQTNEKRNLYKSQGVKLIKLSSTEANGEPTPDFDCRQVISNDFSEIRTTTLTNASVPTSLTAFYDNKGLLRKTIDTSDTYNSTTEFEYDGDGHVISVNNVSLETDNHVQNTELHIWKYEQGNVESMIKIKNGTDTTLVKLVKDEKGNIIEEHPSNHRLDLPVIYYYYDANNRLTDIVRYNEKAKRLLPDYIFEKDPNGRIQSMLFLPAGTNEYQKWLYRYNERGLLEQEACYNKKGQLLGKVNYEYN
jgi:YD repeat-containing protein